MNFKLEFKKGQQGGNKGLPLGSGLENISHAINGTQKGRIISVAAAPKTGKSTFTDYAFLIQPYLYSLENDVEIEWIYNSYEIDRVSKEFDIATYFLFHDFNISFIELDNGVTKKGVSVIPLSSDYLRGRILDDKGNLIKVNDFVKECLKKVYANRIIPIFGEYNDQGLQTKEGVVDFISERDNPTGVYKYLLEHAKKNGSFVTQGKRLVSYTLNNPDKYTIIITDHLRKLIPERGYNLKQTVDKFVEYTVILRNLCQYTFIHIIHTNRNLADSERKKYAKDMLYPQSEDIKETGNLSEDSDYVFTMFNPNDDRYNLNKHFGKEIKDRDGNLLYPNMRTVHLVESRHCEYPQHFRVDMRGNLKSFSKTEI